MTETTANGTGVAAGLTRALRRGLPWLLAPLWAVQLLTAYKSFAGNRLLGSPSLNRRGLHVWRLRLAARLAARRRARLARHVPAADVEAFDRDGFVVKPDFLPPETFARMREEVRGFEAAAQEFREGDAVTRRIPLTPGALHRLPACAVLARHPEFRALARYVSGFAADPMLYIQTVFSQVEGAAWSDPQTQLHRDTFHPVMKAWLYLDDITADVGPLTYAPGTHRPTPGRLAWEHDRSIWAADTRIRGGAFRIAADALPTVGGEQGVRRFDVPANTLIMADTFGFHARAASAAPSIRVEIYASARRRPFSLWTRPGVENLPGVRGRLGAWGDALEHLFSPQRRQTVPVRRVPRTGGYAPLQPWPDPRSRPDGGESPRT